MKKTIQISRTEEILLEYNPGSCVVRAAKKKIDEEVVIRSIHNWTAIFSTPEDAAEAAEKIEKGAKLSSLASKKCRKIILGK